MTREEAKLQLLGQCNGMLEQDGTYFLKGTDAETVIDWLCDDFESRICENCVHWAQENYHQKTGDKGMCRQYSDTDKYYAIGITHSNYGCNRFKKL